MEENSGTKKAMALLMVMADTIKEFKQSSLGGIPSGHLYVQLGNLVNLDSYYQLIALLKKLNWIKEEYNLLIWIKD